MEDQDPTIPCREGVSEGSREAPQASQVVWEEPDGNYAAWDMELRFRQLSTVDGQEGDRQENGNEEGSYGLESEGAMHGKARENLENQDRSSRNNPFISALQDHREIMPFSSCAQKELLVSPVAENYANDLIKHKETGSLSRTRPPFSEDQGLGRFGGASGEASEDQIRSPDTRQPASSVVDSQFCNTCSVCGKEFSQSTDLIVHQRSHAEEKSYQCSGCGEVFTAKADLRMHLDVRKGKKYIDCPKVSAKLHSFRECRILRSGEKIYECSHCPVMSPQASSVKRHQKVHVSAKRFKCLVCDKSFSQLSSLSHHQNVHIYECSDCGKDLKGRTSLRRHKKFHSRTQAQEGL